MTPPIRPAVHALVDYHTDEPEHMTLRQIINWYKQGVLGAQPLGMLTAMESKYMNERYWHLCELVANHQGVPVGMLSYFCGEVAQKEIQLADASADALAVSIGGA